MKQPPTTPIPANPVSDTELSLAALRSYCHDSGRLEYHQYLLASPLISVEAKREIVAAWEALCGRHGIRQSVNPLTLISTGQLGRAV